MEFIVLPEYGLCPWKDHQDLLESSLLLAWLLLVKRILQSLLHGLQPVNYVCQTTVSTHYNIIMMEAV